MADSESVTTTHLTFGFSEALESAFTNSMLVADLLASKEVAVVG